MDIVFFSMSPYSDWQRGVNNRNYNIFKQVCQQPGIGKVLNIDFLPFSFRKAAKICANDLLEDSGLELVEKRPLSRLSKVNNHIFVYSSAQFYFSPNIFFKELRRLLDKLEFKDFIVWSYDQINPETLKNIGQKMTVFDMVDKWSEHPSFIKYRQQLTHNYSVISNKADYVFTVSEKLRDFFLPKKNVSWIPNGVDLDLFSSNQNFIPKDIKDIPWPIIGYVGTIEDRVDFDLINYLAKNNPEKSFVFIGPVWNTRPIRKLNLFSNVYFLGRKSYEKIPSYLNVFDVGIIPHKINQFTRSMNPMKMFDYLAAGKPVITTDGMDMFNDLIYTVKNKEQFNYCIDDALRSNDLELSQKRRNAVKSCSWESRVKEMLQKISG